MPAVNGFRSHLASCHNNNHDDDEPKGILSLGSCRESYCLTSKQKNTAVNITRLTDYGYGIVFILNPSPPHK